MFERVQKLLDRLSIRAVFNRLDRRKLQNELDTHKLFLLTSHHLKTSTGQQLGQQYVQELAAQATELKHEAELRQQQQAAALASPKARRPRGLAAALGAADPRQSPSPTQLPPHPNPSYTPSQPETPTPASEQEDNRQLMPDESSTSSDSSSSSDSDDETSPPPTSALKGDGLTAASDVSNAGVRHQSSRQSMHRPALTLATLSEALRAKLGYSLHVGPSGIAHADAGQGLWLDGRAPVGAVVALYPGLVYTPMHYRRIPGFPKIDTNNDYFLARFDGALIDGQSWTRVSPSAGSMQNISPPEGAAHRALLDQLQQLESWEDVLRPIPTMTKHDCMLGMTSAPARTVNAPSHVQRSCARMRAVAKIVRELLNSAKLTPSFVRHPLAQAHFANHPPVESTPNVMVAAYDFALQPGEEAWLKAYIPNVMYQDQSAPQAQEFAEQSPHSSIVKGIAFVATRELQDEELLLNYRLNPQVQKPEWYSPVDVGEDKRRWY